MCTTWKACAGPPLLGPVELKSQAFVSVMGMLGSSCWAILHTYEILQSALQRAQVLLLQTATKSPHWFSGPVFPTCPPMSEPLSYRDPFTGSTLLSRRPTRVSDIEASTETLKAWLGLSPGSLSSASFLSVVFLHNHFLFLSFI